VGEAWGRDVTVFSLETAFSKLEDCRAWLKTASNSVGLHCNDFSSDESDETDGEGAQAPEPDIVLLVTLDALFVRNSAPLDQSFVYLGACSLGTGTAFASIIPNANLLVDNAVMVGWSDTVLGGQSDAASVEWAKWTIEQGLRSKDAFDKIMTRTSTSIEDGETTVASIRLFGAEDVRTRDIVNLTDSWGQSIRPGQTDLLVFEYEGDDGWVADLRVLESGGVDAGKR
jgi:hypothetical protein